MPNIFISGSLAYDDIMVFPHHFKDYFHPEKLHQINVSFAVESLAKHLGGIATNVSYALAQTEQFVRSQQPKANSQKLHIYPVGAVGRDGGELLEFFKNNNIHTSYVLKDEKLYTATGKVITDMNDNQIWGFYYGACCLNPKLETLKGNHRLDSRLRGNDTGSAIKPTNYELRTTNSQEFWIVSATHEKPFSSVLRHVIKNKLPYMFDPGMALTWIRDDLLKKGVLNATYVVGNDYEIAMIEKRLKMSVKELSNQGVNIITTLGEKGVKFDPSHLSQNNDLKTMIVKGIRVRKVVDPTGAGDAWRGGFVGALVAGKPIRECLVMGNVMASFAVQTMGTVEYKANALEIERRIKTLNSKQ